MRGLLLIVVFSLTGCSTFHTSKDKEDHWFAEDKAKHFGYSTATAFGTTWGARAMGAPTLPAAEGGFTVTISGGLLKELWDATASDGSGWSWKDLTWDLAGSLVGTGIGAVTPVPDH